MMFSVETAIVFLVLVLPELTQSQNCGCGTSKDEMDYAELEVSLDCLGSDFTIDFDFDVEGSLSNFNLGLLCSDQTCANYTSIMPQMPPIEGSRSIIGIVSCFVVGCYTVTMGGLPPQNVFFSSQNCTLGGTPTDTVSDPPVSAISTIPTTSSGAVASAPDSSTTPGTTTVTSSSLNSRHLPTNFTTTTIKDGLYYAAIIVPISFILTAIVIIAVSIKIWKVKTIQKDSSHLYFPQTILPFDDEFDCNFQPVALEESAKYICESQPSLYSPLRQSFCNGTIKLTNSDTSSTESKLDDEKSINFFHCEPHFVCHQSDLYLEQDSTSKLNSVAIINKRTSLPDNLTGYNSQMDSKDEPGEYSSANYVNDNTSDSSRDGYIEYSNQVGDSGIPEAPPSNSSDIETSPQPSVNYKCSEVVFEFNHSKPSGYPQCVICDCPVSFEFKGSHSKLYKQNEAILFTVPPSLPAENYIAKSLDDLLTFRDRKFESILTPSGYVVPLDSELYEPCCKETEDVDKHTDIDKTLF